MPAPPVLLVEGNQLAVAARARVAARVGQQHQREQTHRLRIVGDEMVKTAGQTNRLVCQVGTLQSIADAAGIAFVEDQIEDVAHRAQSLGAFVRLIPSEMESDTDEPLIPRQWRRRLLVPYAAAVLIRTEGGLEAASEADRLMNRYDQDFMAFRAAHGTAKRPTFRVATPGWDSNDEFPNDRFTGSWR